jgi:hypothetical protein
MGLYHEITTCFDCYVCLLDFFCLRKSTCETVEIRYLSRTGQYLLQAGQELHTL